MRNPLKLHTVNALDEPLPNVADDPEVKALLDERAALMRRLDQANERFDVARARLNRAARPAHSVAEMGRRLVKGAMILAYDAEDDLQAAREEQDILLEAIAGIQPRLEQVVFDRSLAIAERFREPYREAMRAVFRATVALHDAMQSCRAIKVRMVVAGYKTANVGLPDFHLKGALVLGDPYAADRYRNEACAFRHALESWGVNTK